MIYLRAIGWFLWDLRRPFQGLPAVAEAIVAIVYIGGGAVAAAVVEGALLRLSVIGAFLAGAVFVLGVRQRYELGVNRPNLRFEPGAWRSNRPSDMTAFREVYRASRRVAVDKILVPGAIKYVLVGVRNDPPGLQETATVKHASIILKYEEIAEDGSLRPFLPHQPGLYGVWWDNPFPTPDTPWDSIRYRDLVPSHNDIHRLILARANDTGWYAAYEGSFEVTSTTDDVAAIPDGYRLTGRTYRVTVTISGTRMPRPLTQAFRLATDGEGSMEVAPWEA